MQLYRFKTAEALKNKTLCGVKFKIDRPKGYEKVWKQPNGSEKRFVYPCDYGFFPGIDGEDGEGLDAFVGDAPDGHFEAFQKLKKDDAGRDVLDETKFLVGVTDQERETIYRLYGPEVWARRVFHDVNELMRAVAKFKPGKKDRYKSAALNERNPLWEEMVSRANTQHALKDFDSKGPSTSDENSMGALYSEGPAQ